MPEQELVLAANTAFYQAFSQKDLGEMNRIWWQGTTSLCIHPGGQLLLGWEVIQASWVAIFKNTDAFEIDTEVVKIEVDQSLAWVTVRETVLQTSQGRKFKAQSLATNIFQKMAQQWYLIHHHGSPVIR